MAAALARCSWVLGRCPSHGHRAVRARARVARAAAADGARGEAEARGACATADRALTAWRRDGKRGGGPATVWLVGTGPGDVGMVTLRAAQLMQQADVVLYDRLVSDDVLALCNPAAVMVYVGKASGFHTRNQEEIHELLLAFAQTPGATVVRLKGGDPCVFGRGGEEAEYLVERGVDVRVVPGITAAAGISASVGVPLTHRGVAASVRFLTGHLRAGVQEDTAEGEAMAAAAAADAALGPAAANQGEPAEGSGTLAGQTLVVYMGLQTLPCLVEALFERGGGRSTPAVAVENGTTPHERRVFATLDALPGAVVESDLRSPTLVVIGDVVALAPEWREADGWTTGGWKSAHGALEAGGGGGVDAVRLLANAEEALKRGNGTASGTSSRAPL